MNDHPYGILAGAILSILNLSGSPINVRSDTLSDLIAFTDCQAGLYDTVSLRLKFHTPDRHLPLSHFRD